MKKALPPYKMTFI